MFSFSSLSVIQLTAFTDALRHNQSVCVILVLTDRQKFSRSL